MQKKDILKWLQEEILPGLVKSGKFAENGESQTLEDCEFEDTEKGSGFASLPSFAKLKVKTANGSKIINCLVKLQPQDPVFRERMRTVPQFKNEVTMYTQVLPAFGEFLKSQESNIQLDCVPKCYYAAFQDHCPEKAILILEDMRDSGFRLAESVTELDLKHCLLAVGRLAEFHAVSFAMKFTDSGTFEKLKKSWVDVWLSDDPESKQQCEDFKGYVAHRGIEYLIHRDNRVPEEYLNKFKQSLAPMFDVLKNVSAPIEPLSVICHGDFNRNNVLYQYQHGEVVDAKLIDFQTFLYASPCLDLSFFIYMNTTLDLREKHFDDIMRHYYSVLIKRISAILSTEEDRIMQKIPFQLFLDDFERVAVNAYVTVSFFLPLMMTTPDDDFDNDITTKTFKEMALENYCLGGDVVTKRVAEVIVDFYKRGFYL